VPTYQYACKECGHQLEAVQSFSDEPLTVCPNCAGRLRKLFTGVGIVFKGSGFYRNDSRKADSSSSNGTESSGEKPAEKTAAKTDSKSESSSSATPAKTESKPSSSSSTAPAAA
jgi:putative FmdB family regulatory protein